MQILLDMLKGLIALIVGAALSLFGVEMHVSNSIDREVERVQICSPERGSNGTSNSAPNC